MLYISHTQLHTQLFFEIVCSTCITLRNYENLVFFEKKKKSGISYKSCLKEKYVVSNDLVFENTPKTKRKVDDCLVCTENELHLL